MCYYEKDIENICSSIGSADSCGDGGADGTEW